ncbi:MAG: hypothetical protein AAFY15_14615 [Cyanobacteria bacterium J06648_11]
MLRIIRDRVCFSILPQLRRSRRFKQAPEPNTKEVIAFEREDLRSRHLGLAPELGQNSSYAPPSCNATRSSSLRGG